LVMKDKLRIFMLNYEFPPIGGGGGQAHRHLLEQYAARDDLQVQVLTSGLGRGFGREAFAPNIIVYKVGLYKKHLHFWRKTEVAEWLLKAKFHYGRLLRENSYDLAHAFFGFPTGWLCYRSADKLPYIISLRGSDVPGANVRLSLDYKLLGPLFGRIWGRSAALVTPSKGLRERALRFMPDVDIEVICNGVDLDRFKPAEKVFSPQELKLLTVGRLSGTKRVELLIEVVALLREHLSGVTLTIAGGGALEQPLRQIVRRKQMQDHVRLMGIVPGEKMAQLYQQHDIFVSASIQEGMSNAMLEAMASGLPIITTRCEGVDELIADNGIVAADASAAVIAGAIEKLAGDEQSFRAMKPAARKRAENFNWADVAQQYIELYRKIVAPQAASLARG